MVYCQYFGDGACSDPNTMGQLYAITSASPDPLRSGHEFIRAGGCSRGYLYSQARNTFKPASCCEEDYSGYCRANEESSVAKIAGQRTRRGMLGENRYGPDNTMEKSK